MDTPARSTLQHGARVLLAGALVFAGLAHFFFSREEFQAQVPDWVRLDKDLVVILSGVVEVLLGVALLVVRRRRALLGLAVGLFFVAVFPRQPQPVRRRPRRVRPGLRPCSPHPPVLPTLARRLGLVVHRRTRGGPRLAPPKSRHTLIQVLPVRWG